MLKMLITIEILPDKITRSKATNSLGNFVLENFVYI